MEDEEEACCRPRKKLKKRRRAEEESDDDDDDDAKAPSAAVPAASAAEVLGTADLEMITARKVRGALRAVEYDFELVPTARRDLEGSVLVSVSDRSVFSDHLSEMLGVCGESAWRRQSKQSSNKHDPKPLMLEYMCDRVDVDDPVWGYELRTNSNMLQGFVVMTTFTTWSWYFRWDSTAASSGITADDLRDRAVDEGPLALELESQPRSGDPTDEGVVFPTIAEVSLLGGLGCGATLLALALKQLETSKKEYKYCVLQATEAAIPFYESMGFIRVGCVAEHHIAGKAPVSSGAQSGNGARKQYALRKALRELLTQLSAEDLTGCFSTPVDVDLVDDYLDVISKPMDFGTMRRRFVKGKYTSLAALTRDFDLICHNCMTYNPPANPWHDAGASLKERGYRKIRAWRSLYPDLALFDATARCDPRELARAADADPNVMGLCVWSFPETPVSDQYPCYMMAKRLSRQAAAATTAPVKKVVLEPATKKKVAPFLERWIASAASAASSALAAKEEVVEEEQLAKDEQPLSCSSVLERRRELEAEWQPKLPRGVSPRGSGYVSKFSAGGHCDYLGYFEELRDAKEAYLETAENYGEDPQQLPLRPLLRDAEWLKSILSRRSELLKGSSAELLPVPSRMVRQPEWRDWASSHDTLVSAALAAALKQKKQHPLLLLNKLYDAVVVLVDQPPCYGKTRFWYVHQYIPDLRWVHLCPLRSVGSLEQRRGRPKYMLVPEGMEREIDVSSSRCVQVRSEMVKKTTDANDEVFDIDDPTLHDAKRWDATSPIDDDEDYSSKNINNFFRPGAR